MQLTLYENFSKRSNSTKRPEGGYNVDVKLKANTSVEAPVFLIDGINLDINYCKWNNHYYFINDIMLGNNNIYELHCTQDLLATFKDDIGDYTAFVERSASNYNVNLPDEAVTCSEQASVYAHEHATLSWFNSTGCYVVRVIGHQTVQSKGGITSYVMSADEVKQLMSICYSQPGSSVFDDIINAGDEVENALARAIFKPSQYILSIHWLPLQKQTVAGAGQTVFLGEFRTDMTAQCVQALGVSANTVIPIPANTYGDFRDVTEPFTQYTLYLGGVGAIPISAKDVVAGMVAAYSIDFLTGDTEIEVMTGGLKLIGSYKTNIAVHIPIGGMTSDIGGSIAMVGSGAISGSSAGIGGIIGGAAGGLIKGITHLMNPTPSVLGTQSSMTSLQAFPYVWMSKRVMGSGDIPIESYGRPLCKNVRIGSLSGFVKCAGASIDLPSLKDDRDAVNSLLNSGFYFE